MSQPQVFSCGVKSKKILKKYLVESDVGYEAISLHKQQRGIHLQPQIANSCITKL